MSLVKVAETVYINTDFVLNVYLDSNGISCIAYTNGRSREHETTKFTVDELAAMLKQNIT